MSLSLCCSFVLRHKGNPSAQHRGSDERRQAGISYDLSEAGEGRSGEGKTLLIQCFQYRDVSFATNISSLLIPFLSVTVPKVCFHYCGQSFKVCVFHPAGIHGGRGAAEDYKIYQPQVCIYKLAKLFKS